MALPIVTLTTDFGLKDPYVAEMKAVILDVCPDTTIVDISHGIEKFNIRVGAYVLASVSSYFPKKTIHVAVVDPGVGTRRSALLIETRQGFLIGPDNGVLALAAHQQNIRHIYRITNPKLMLPRISKTFHGRDVFAPAAGHVARGVAGEEFGPKIKRITVPRFAKVIKAKDRLVGEIIYIDDFGNIFTNFVQNEINSLYVRNAVTAQLCGTTLKLKLGKKYSDVKPQRQVAIIGSHQLLEISINQGNAARRLSAKIGDRVILRRL